MLESTNCSKCQEAFTELGPAACFCHRCMGELSHVVQDLYSKVQLCINEMSEAGLLQDGVYAFPDGDIWEPEEKKEAETNEQD